MHAMSLSHVVFGALMSTALWVMPVSAYVLVTTEDGTPAHWETTCVPWSINARGSEDVDDLQVQEAMQTAFDTWEATQSHYVSFQYRGATCVDTVGFVPWMDTYNVVLWRDDVQQWPYAERVVGLTSVTLDAVTGVIADADIEWNGIDYEFSIGGSPESYDLQAAATHEVGHLLGLGHSENPNATMWKKSKEGEVNKRQLHSDDIAGVSASHPLVVDLPTDACEREWIVGSWDEPDCPEEPEDEIKTGWIGCSSTQTPWRGAWPLVVCLAALHLRSVRRRHARCM